MLRRLLVHGDVSRAWRVAGFPKEPKVKRFDNLNEDSLGLATGNIVMMQGSGGTTRANLPSLSIMSHVDPTEMPRVMEEIQRRLSYPRQASADEVSLTPYLQGTCLIIDNVKITRSAVITFVANKLGGARWDPRLSDLDQQEMFDAMTHYFTDHCPSIYHQRLLMARG